MKIYVNGDSWSRNTWAPTFPHDVSWPSYLRETYDVEIINESAGCGSNSRMFDNLQTFFQLGHRPDLVLIALTGENRWHLPTKNRGCWNIGPTVLNDRTGVKDESILKWWRLECLDRLEYVYQYWNIIWKIHNFCETTLGCPVIFFTSWMDTITLEKELFDSETMSITQWVLKHSTLDHKDIIIQTYVQLFEFFNQQKQSWFFDRQSWKSRLDKSEICGPLDFDPGHPNKLGHISIANFVLNSISEFQPKIYQEILNNKKVQI